MKYIRRIKCSGRTTFLEKNELLKEKQEERRLLYQVAANEIHVFKTQQWTIGYYVLLLFGALYAVSIEIFKLPKCLVYCLFIFLGITSLIIFLYAIHFINSLQRSLLDSRKRIVRYRRTFSLKQNCKDRVLDIESMKWSYQKEYRYMFYTVITISWGSLIILLVLKIIEKVNALPGY